MSVNLSVPATEIDGKPRITVIGVGGAGGNAVNNMIKANLEGVEFAVANTDAQAIGQSLCTQRIQLGINITQGLGAGARPDIGRAAAEEVLDTILEHLQGSNMVFIAAGMGGGTGTGAAPVIARAAREQGILTVGVVSKPFHFEGTHRMRLAESGIEELQHYVDTLIVIPNQNLFRIANERTTFADAFKMADDVLYSGVRGVTDLMVMPGLINLDFADVRAVMSEMGKAMMGTGEAEGDRRAVDAAEAAISNPLLDDVSMRGARGVLINITGGFDMTLFEVDEAANRIREEVDPEANIIFGSTFDDTMEGRMRVSVVATGIDGHSNRQEAPQRADALDRPNPTPRAVQSLGPAPTSPQIRPAATVGAPPQAIVPGQSNATGQSASQLAQAIAERRAAELASRPRPSTQPIPERPVQPTAPRVAPAAASSGHTAPTNLGSAPGNPSLAMNDRVSATAAKTEPAASESTGSMENRLAEATARALRDEMAQRISSEDAAARAGDGRPFIAPEPVRPAMVQASPAPQTGASAHPMSEDRTVMPQRPTGTDTPPAAAKAPSLFERVTGAARPRAPGDEAGVGTPLRPVTPAQTQMSGLDPAGRGDGGDDDLLDIPAFLRRQAN